MNTTRLELLFPIPVLITKVEKHQEYRKTILPKIISEFKDDPNRSLSWGSLCHTWQSTAQRIWDEQFDKTVKDYLNNLQVKAEKLPLEIESWFNVHDANMYQEAHEHLPALVSGIYYLQLDGSPAIFLNPSRTDLLLPNTFPNHLNIQEGDLVIFPSELKHLVKRSGSENLRVSYSFNIHLRGWSRPTMKKK